MQNIATLVSIPDFDETMTVALPSVDESMCLSVASRELATITSDYPTGRREELCDNNIRSYVWPLVDLS
jgi:hypothetical protein